MATADVANIAASSVTLIGLDVDWFFVVGHVFWYTVEGKGTSLRELGILSNVDDDLLAGTA